ncbi:hypothetical protein GCM10017600_06500 [Streptosporangium carneum]|uniref:Uncharacterized protein n=1 Tax=Streptosporangium carneum TaxID=47481 RepID=A0A9W6HVS7_9ACTN|nr:hypothetical protein GCM10017600_06500 [Streptosporangium carneum]
MLADAADAAPGPEGDLVETVRMRWRRRARRRLQSAFAVLGVLAVVGGGTAVARGAFFRGGGEGDVFTAVTPTAAQSSALDPDVVDIRPVSEIWPSAVFKIPAAAADGWKYRPITGLSATQLLLSAESSFEKAGRLEVYDTTAGRSTVLTQMPAPEGVKGYFAQDVEVGTDYVAWWGETPNTPDKWADFWVAPRTGGPARRVGEVTGALAEVTRLGVTRDSVVWSAGDGGIYRMPLGGGASERIEGTEGLHLLTWPWAADAGGKDEETVPGNQTRLVNLETGQTTEVDVQEEVKGLRCGPVWCFGAEGGAALAQRPDGSDRRTLPGLGEGSEPSLLTGGTGFLGFFGVLGVGPQEADENRYVPLAVVYDPATGATAGIGERDRNGGGGFGVGISSSPTSIVYWDADEKQAQECEQVDATSLPLTGPSGAPTPTGKVRACTTTQKGGGKEFTVVNLLAVPAITQ